MTRRPSTTRRTPYTIGNTGRLVVSTSDGRMTFQLGQRIRVNALGSHLKAAIRKARQLGIRI